MSVWHPAELGAGLRRCSAATRYEAGSAVDGKEPTARMVRCHHVVLRHGVGGWVTIRFLVPVRSMLRGRTSRVAHASVSVAFMWALLGFNRVALH
jgi:hypothetical protein